MHKMNLLQPRSRRPRPVPILEPVAFMPDPLDPDPAFTAFLAILPHATVAALLGPDRDEGDDLTAC